VASVVAGVRSPAQAESAAAWATTDLPEDTWRALTTITEGLTG
jgi:aryl-alcohol dehydrogenase-like predicted oxidoreductase